MWLLVSIFFGLSLPYPWICCLDSSVFFLFNHVYVSGCTESVLLHAGFLSWWWAGATLRCGVCVSYCCGFSCCRAWALGYRCRPRGAQAELRRGMWDLPRPGIKPVSPATVGGFLATAPPGKSWILQSYSLPLGHWTRSPGLFSLLSSCLYCGQLTISSSRSKPLLSANPRSHFANWCLPLDVSWDLTPRLPELSENHLPPYQAPCWSFCLNWPYRRLSTSIHSAEQRLWSFLSLTSAPMSNLSPRPAALNFGATFESIQFSSSYHRCSNSRDDCLWSGLRSPNWPPHHPSGLFLDQTQRGHPEIQIHLPSSASHCD